MGMIASDFFGKYDKIEIFDTPFTVGELMEMASVEVQEQFTSWTAQNEDLSYLPAEVLFALLEDKAFFARLLEILDSGERVAISGVTLAVGSAHMSKMGLTAKDVRENLTEFFAKSDDIIGSIESVLMGTRYPSRRPVT